MAEPAESSGLKYAVCPRIEPSATRRPKLFDSLSAAQVFLWTEGQFPLDNKELAAEFSLSAKQEVMATINQGRFMLQSQPVQSDRETVFWRSAILSLQHRRRRNTGLTSKTTSSRRSENCGCVISTGPSSRHG